MSCSRRARCRSVSCRACAALRPGALLISGGDAPMDRAFRLRERVQAGNIRRPRTACRRVIAARHNSRTRNGSAPSSSSIFFARSMPSSLPSRPDGRRAGFLFRHFTHQPLPKRPPTRTSCPTAGSPRRASPSCDVPSDGRRDPSIPRGAAMVSRQNGQPFRLLVFGIDAGGRIPDVRTRNMMGHPAQRLDAAQSADPDDDARPLVQALADAPRP